MSTVPIRSASGSSPDPRGSMWRRWEPHIHAPGTALNDQYGSASLADFVAALEGAGPSLEAVGVTDYLSTDGYEAVLRLQRAGRLSKIGLLFPNVELRLGIGTNAGAGINMHLLISPDDPSHVEEIARFLARLCFRTNDDKFYCNRAELIRLGKAHDPTISDEALAYREGVNQFKVNFDDLREQFEGSEWIRNNALVAVAGSSYDGTAGLQDDSAAFAAQRRAIESFADLIFSGSEKQAAYWAGRGVRTVEEIERAYRRLKPCIHGSDAHKLEKVARPDLDRRCWIKGDASFDTLKQACIEPESRVHIGPEPPDSTAPTQVVQRVRTTKAPWLLDGGIDINPGLVAVIGARGSGKTALADLMAHGANSNMPLANKQSFISRATDHLQGAQVELTWSGGTVARRDLTTYADEDFAEVHYLSQQFVDRLCSAEGLNDELIDEIEKVVFAAHDPAERLGSTSFRELLDQKIGDTRIRRQYLRERLDRIASDVLVERVRSASLPSKEANRKNVVATLAQDSRTRMNIVGKGQKERAEYYTRLRTAIDERNRRVQAVERQRQSLEHMTSEVRRYEAQVFPDLTGQLRRQYELVGLTDAEWDAFDIGFRGAVRQTLAARKVSLDKMLQLEKDGTSTKAPAITMVLEELQNVSLGALTAEFGQVQKSIGMDQQNDRKLKQLNERIAANQLELKKFDDEIAICKVAPDRLKELFTERSALYEEFFELVVAEEASLRELYHPLEGMLSAGNESVRRLRLVVVRKVDLESWAFAGEELLDLRKNGKFRGRGALADYAKVALLPAWESGDAKAVAEAMAKFRAEYDKAFQVQAKVESTSPEYRQWTIDIGRWLYETEHIQVSYSFEYDGVPLSQLSPGTRGIVLLLLYLALDLEDHRPLIIDQPEENLDPRSVFAELVDLFRSARSRRQVIIVTHNANLVVNTDVDQVIVAEAKRPDQGRPPVISYVSGGLENVQIRERVCEILEGGEAAFRERAKRLRVRY